MNTITERIQSLICSNKDYYTKIAIVAADESKGLCESFRDRADWVSGWAHAFVCPNCAAKMVFDESLSYSPPNDFICENCGKISSSTALDEAWVYYYRITVASRLESSAVCALLGDEEALHFLERYFDFYADNYDGFAIHGHGNGKIMPQILDEAVWCILVLRALYPCRKLFSLEKRNKWFKKLFYPLVKLIDAPEHQWGIHNHVLWHKCAVGAVGLCFDDQTLLTEALEGPLGIWEQVTQGFNEDYFWFEGSPLYHYYSLEALTGFCQFLEDQIPNHPLMAILEKAYIAPLLLSYDGWQIPSINDGWYPLTLDRFADQIHRAAMCIHSDALLQQMDHIRKHNPKAIATPGSLLIDRVPDIVKLWTASNLAIIKFPFHAILKSGSIAESHRHRDYLSLIIPPFSNDLGTPGYGHELYQSWYVLAASHNTVTIDFDQPHEIISTHIEKVDGGVRAVVDSGWSDVISASRTLTTSNNTLYDLTEISCADDHTIDWIFHTEGAAKFSAAPSKSAFIGDRCGYEYFTDVYRLDCDNLTAEFTLNDYTLFLTVDTSQFETFIAKTPGNPATVKRTALIFRSKGKYTVFNVAYTLGKKI
ncbi:MAG TPA: alginate lyase family protein [Candidatus Eisenbergiella merdipullorum]|uniref:Alginate lyase family protein n=1 Tax=Candidatus Eisenbergiella merdipullorum TaxID=2838553 RepID=A0A9D2I2S1_9FIRM|nr:alginate lyase family protein [Candidatus Eisenbergiella merdipullorum]